MEQGLKSSFNVYIGTFFSEFSIWGEEMTKIVIIPDFAYYYRFYVQAFGYFLALLDFRSWWEIEHTRISNYTANSSQGDIYFLHNSHFI